MHLTYFILQARHQQFNTAAFATAEYNETLYLSDCIFVRIFGIFHPQYFFLVHLPNLPPWLPCLHDDLSSPLLRPRPW